MNKIMPFKKKEIAEEPLRDTKKMTVIDRLDLIEQDVNQLTNLQSKVLAEQKRTNKLITFLLVAIVLCFLVPLMFGLSMMGMG